MPSNRKRQTRRYRVMYSVLRREFYEIEATSAEQAKELAFSEGEQVDDCDAMDVDACDIEEIRVKP